MNSKRAKELLENIPTNEFIVGDYTDYKGRCCAIGHLIRLSSNNPTDYSMDNCEDIHDGEIYDFVRGRVSQYIMEVHNENHYDLSNVNNSTCINGYIEDEPKTRVIHLLNDMIEAGY